MHRRRIGDARPRTPPPTKRSSNGPRRELLKYNAETQRRRNVVKLTPEERQKESEELLARINEFAFSSTGGTAGAHAPACKQQESFKSIYGNGEKTQYQHTFEQTGR